MDSVNTVHLDLQAVAKGLGSLVVQIEAALVSRDQQIIAREKDVNDWKFKFAAAVVKLQRARLKARRLTATLKARTGKKKSGSVGRVTPPKRRRRSVS